MLYLLHKRLRDKENSLECLEDFLFQVELYNEVENLE